MRKSISVFLWSKVVITSLLKTTVPHSDEYFCYWIKSTTILSRKLTAFYNYLHSDFATLLSLGVNRRTIPLGEIYKALWMRTYFGIALRGFKINGTTAYQNLDMYCQEARIVCFIVTVTKSTEKVANWKGKVFALQERHSRHTAWSLFLPERDKLWGHDLFDLVGNVFMALK
jgi:hypothetical protein